MKDRYIGENVRLVFEIIEYLQKENKPGLLFFADYEKAFDSLSHQFILNTLNNLNFGNDFIQWVKLFYTDISSIIVNNGNFSEPFVLERGVRQGCPLSSSLFILCVEILSNFIENDDEIKGIKITNKEIKQSFFADDATFVNDGSMKSFEKLVYVITEFSKISGLNLNSKKSTILRVGSLKDTNIIYCKNKKFNWTCDSAKTLGLFFSSDYKRNTDLNLEPKLNEFFNCLKQWQHRKLTLMGKVMVIKTFALPKLIYPFSVLNNPSNEKLKEIIKAMFNFLWEGKPEKIKRITLTQNFKNGGIKMIDINYFLNSIKASWIKRYINKENKGAWKFFIEQKIKQYGNEFIFECNVSKNEINTFFPQNTFMNDVCSSWFYIQSEHNKNEMNLKDIVWNNAEIKIDNKLVYYKTWHDKGILYIEHLYDYRKKDFYTYEDFKNIYGIKNTDYLKYHMLKNNIPKYFLDRLKTNTIHMEYQDTLLKKVNKSNAINKLMYNIQLDEKNSNTNEEKWAREIDTILNWKKIYMIPFKSTTDVTLRNFQYKFLHRLITTNTMLFKFNLCDSNLCDLCCSNIETLHHLFWECTIVQNLWSNLHKFFLSKY